MSDQLSRRTNGAAAVTAESALVSGDLASMTTEERLAYYSRVCESLGLNPYTRPFDFLQLGGRTVLYARRDCTDQLRTLRSVSILSVEVSNADDLCTVTVRARVPDGREDMDIGVVSTAGLKGEALANARMKAHTKAKRRVTLSICGLGLMDESEVEGAGGTPLPAPPEPLRIAVIDPTPVAAPIINTQAARNAAWGALTSTEGWTIADGDLHAARERVGQLLGRRVERLAHLTAADFDAARAELLARNAARARYFAVVGSVGNDEEAKAADRARIGNLLGITVTSRTLLTADQWATAADILERGPMDTRTVEPRMDDDTDPFETEMPAPSRSAQAAGL